MYRGCAISTSQRSTDAAMHIDYEKKYQSQEDERDIAGGINADLVGKQA